jgi:hypothetical protein
MYLISVLSIVHLAKTKGQNISISSTYILFLTKLQKGKPRKMDLPF